MGGRHGCRPSRTSAGSRRHRHLRLPLADQALWQARINPRRRVCDLTGDDVDRLHRALRNAVRAATAAGSVHTLRIVLHRLPSGTCPRDGVPLTHATVGGRTTWWCPRDQPA